MRWYADPATRAFIARRYLPWLTAVLGAGYTLFSEWMNVSVLRNWAYAAPMPTIDVAGFKLGLSPLAQWLVVPPLALYLSTRSAGRRFGMNRE
jgi:hypothetical protein